MHTRTGNGKILKVGVSKWPPSCVLAQDLQYHFHYHRLLFSFACYIFMAVDIEPKVGSISFGSGY